MRPEEVTAADQVGFPVLLLLIVLPLVGCAVLQLVRDERAARFIAIAAAGVELALAAFLALRFNAGVDDIQFVERSDMVLGVSWHLGVDGVNLLFIPLTALLGLLVIVYAEHQTVSSRIRDARHYAMATLALEATLIGAFASLDLVVFWFFFVAELVPSWYLITRWGTGAQRRPAAREYVAFMTVGAALMLAGILLLGRSHAQSTGDGLSFDLLALLGADIPAESQTLIFFLLFFGFAIKAPIFPFHTWLPKVLEHGPVVAIGVFLVGVKLGTYGLLRFVIPILPDAASEWFWLMALLGVTGTVYGSLLAINQSNLRRLVAYASLAHMGVVMLGLFSLNLDGFEGGLLQMVNLGIVGAGLFFIAGFLTTRVGPPEVGALGGLVHHAPLLTGAFLVVALAGIGLPGTNGFNGEHLVMLGAYEQHWSMAIAAGLGVFLTAAYSLTFFLRGFMGSARPAVVERVYDLTRTERGIVLTLAAVIFWIGLGTGPFIQAMRPSLTAVEQRIEQRTEDESGAPGAVGIERVVPRG
ncbi:MAG: NADH-quinone oxidoreductase subunit M [Geodermatophilaceae bacterium]|nr:NADH-quinone oxidoreductase subunit M [Geodermatophilaceae bacterium]